MSVNKMQILGSVGQAPKISTTQQGKKIASFSVATSEKWKDKQTGEKKENTTWHNVVVYSEGLAEIVEKYVNKGSKIYIEGPLKKRKYKDKEGIEREVCEVVLNGFDSKLELLDSKKDSNLSQEANNALDQVADSIPDDDIPF